MSVLLVVIGKKTTTVVEHGLDQHQQELLVPKEQPVLLVLLDRQEIQVELLAQPVLKERLEQEQPELPVLPVF
jgi:hypothetical protein